MNSRQDLRRANGLSAPVILDQIVNTGFQDLNAPCIYVHSDDTVHVAWQNSDNTFGLASDIWYATTDADSVVPADWLLQMTAADADMVLGVVRVPAWRHYPAEVARRYMRAYQSKGPGHNHVHGANMGFRADAYWAVGGFRALPTGEDVELVDRFEAENMRIHRDAKLSVATSDRQNGRAPGGFAKHLRELSGSVRKKTAGA